MDSSLRSESVPILLPDPKPRPWAGSLADCYRHRPRQWDGHICGSLHSKPRPSDESLIDSCQSRTRLPAGFQTDCGLKSLPGNGSHAGIYELEPRPWEGLLAGPKPRPWGKPMSDYYGVVGSQAGLRRSSEDTSKLQTYSTYCVRKLNTTPSIRTSKDPEEEGTLQGDHFQDGNSSGRQCVSETTKSDSESNQDSFDYLPSHSAVYKDWLRSQPTRFDWDRWVVMGVIGVVTGVVGVLLHQLIHLTGQFKWTQANALIQDRNLLFAWIWVVSYSALLATVASSLVVFLCPSAGGSGIPEVIGFLNGTVMRTVLSLPTFVVKFISCFGAVGSGLPVGPEGPMIHMGSILGNGLSQFRSRTLNFSLPFFTRFRNSEDRRNFTTAGAAAGVAAAFGAPVGGLLFALEEVASFWTLRLGSMVFLACSLATVTAALLNSAFEAVYSESTHHLGLFRTTRHFILQLGSAVEVNVVMFGPAVALGLIGGILGALFTIAHLRIATFRRDVIARVESPVTKKALRVLEPPFIMVLWAIVTVFLPAAFPCRQYAVSLRTTVPVQLEEGIPTCSTHVLSSRCEMDCASSSHRVDHVGNHDNGIQDNGSLMDCRPASNDDAELERFWCREPAHINGTSVGGEYSEVASLLNVDGMHALRQLFSRGTHLRFGYLSLLTILPLQIIFTCWAASSAISSGIVVPMMFIGALYGRAVGLLLTDAHGRVPTDSYWTWIDPGAMALVGAASFFAGVSRLTMSLSVIMIEMTNDAALLLPTMAAILVAKWTGDFLTRPLYHALLDFKAIPYLDYDTVVYDDQLNPLNLELFVAGDVMHGPAVTVRPAETPCRLARLLLDTTHGGFPVVGGYPEHNDAQHEVLCGFITRSELQVILGHVHRTRSTTTSGSKVTPKISFEELSVDRPHEGAKHHQVLENFTTDPIYRNVIIDLEPFINRSSSYVREDFSLHRTYVLFRTLGLRHLTVVDLTNRVRGIITRKDLMRSSLEERLDRIRRSSADRPPVDRKQLLVAVASDLPRMHGVDSFV